MPTNDPPTLARCVESTARLDRDALREPLPLVHLLDNGRVFSMVTAAGSGYIHYDDRALTRWRPDGTRDANGYYLYIRDLDTRQTWSAGFQPTRVEPESYEVQFAPGRVEILRRDHDVQSRVEICVAPGQPVELRRCTLTNLSDRPRRLELTSYAEWVLNEPGADSAHPAFSKLFVETSFEADRTLIVARRRPRSSDELPLAAGHFIVDATASGESGAVEFETDRYRFLGRSKSLAEPRALADLQPLSGTVGPVLDPIACLRTVIELPPLGSQTITLALCAGANVDDVRHAAAAFAVPSAVEVAFQNAGDFAVQELLNHGMAPADLNQVSRIAAERLYGARFEETPTALSCNPPECTSNGNQPESPLQIQPRIHAYLLGRGIASPAYENAKCAPTSLKPPTSMEYHRAAEAIDQPPPGVGDLSLNNGYGGFSHDGVEYVMRIRPGDDKHSNLPPLPWSNVICNPQAGFIVTETGAGCTWIGNSRENLLTPWLNDSVSDPHSEAIYLRDDGIRDEDAKTFWSPSPGPAPSGAEYEVRHGFGYTSFQSTSHGLDQQVIQFVPADEPLKITNLRLHNTGDQPRRLSLFSYQRWQLGSRSPQETRQIKSRRVGDILFAENRQRAIFADTVAVSALLIDGAQGDLACTGDRAEFLGRHGCLAKPQAVMQKRPLSGTVGSGVDPCAAWQCTIELAPGETFEAALLLGQFDDDEKAIACVEQYRDFAEVERALRDVREMWRKRLTAVQIETPSPAINLMANGWLPYQNLSCRIWGRSSFYQGGGAYGFRDQLQDAAAYIYHWPELTREQIVRHASHQFVEGDVLHWWHTPDSRGIRTRFSDDLIWLPLFAAEYVTTTGDVALWDESAPFLTAPQVPDGEPEIFMKPQPSGQSGTIYEHCCRALDRSLTSGRHGLPLMGCGDWNDGMSRIGIGGQGESVWLGFFLDIALTRMIPVCQKRGDLQRVEMYDAYREQLRIALNDSGWDGGWYRRAYFDDGTPVGAASSNECQIDALVQAWSVLSGVAPPERAQQAIAAVDEKLVNPEAGIIHLLYPPFDKMDQDPGYIKGYLPGVRENGGQYTHGVLWYIRAVAEMGRGTRAVELLEMISPVTRSATRAAADRYKTEPYVVAADVYGVEPHAGRGGWSWYTGSAGWMWRVAVESILGLAIEDGQRIALNPRISKYWPECSLSYRLPNSTTVYDITIQNPHSRETGVVSVTINGNPGEVRDGAAVIPLVDDGAMHHVVARL